MDLSSATALALATSFAIAACLGPSSVQEGPAGEIAGQVLGKSDVEGRGDRPIEVLVVAIPEAKIDSLRRHVEGDGDTSGQVTGLKGTVQEPFTTFASGHDVSDEKGRYRIEVPESGLHFLCLTGETDVPESAPWRVAGCMEVQVPGGEPVEQDLYMQFGRLVSP